MSGAKKSQNGKVFQWNIANINNFIKETDNDKAVLISLDEIKKQEKLLGRPPRVLEAGCGNGRVIVWLGRHGVKNVCGIEANKEIVKEFNAMFPQYDVRFGDIMRLPKDLKNHDVVLSYGVVEHFVDGPQRPLTQMYKDLANNGTAVVTVPFLSVFRKIKYAMFNRKKWDKSKYKYCLGFYDNGEFYLYFLTKKQFKKELENAGFRVVKHTYTMLNCGTLEALNHKNVPGRFLWRDEKRHFHFTPFGWFLYFLARCMPWGFAHMQLYVCKKVKKHR